jgi:DNA-binding response OmpR family regulator
VIALPPGVYDPDMHQLTGPGGKRRLTPTQHRILMLLVRAKGRPVTHDLMTRAVWLLPCDEPGDHDNVLKVQVAKMRNGFADCGVPRQTVSTLHHIGYYLALSEWNRL